LIIGALLKFITGITGIIGIIGIGIGIIGPIGILGPIDIIGIPGKFCKYDIYGLVCIFKYLI
jgi:hypothetical protein